MLRSIVRSSLQYRFVVVVISVVLMFGGIFQMRNVPVDVLPEFSPPYVEIQTEALGLSADEVEQLITVPLEQDLLNGVPWLATIKSDSVPGLSSIVMVFEPGTDLYRARQMVSERMTQAFALPHVSKPPTMIQPLSSTSRFMIVGLSSKQLSLIEMSVLARWTIAPRLMGVPGVANVAIWGNRDRQLQVQVDPNKLAEQHVSLQKVLETTGNALWVSSLSYVEASTPGTGGFIDTTQQRLGIRHISPIVTSANLAEVPIENTKVRLGDVANVVEDHQLLIGDALTNDESSLLLVIQKFPGTNTLEVTQGVESALAELSPGLAGMEMNTNIFRPADFIQAAVKNLGLALLLGFLFIALILLAFYFDWRRMLVSLIAVPLSLLAAGYVLYLRGATLNVIILLGLLIGLGVIIDDVMVDVDNVTRRLDQHQKSGDARASVNVILDSVLEMRGPAIYAALVLLLSVLPVYFIEGSSNAFFRPLSTSYALAVMASMVVALIVTPALCLILLSTQAEYRVSPIARWLQSAYQGALSSMIQGKAVAFVLIALFTILGLTFLPSFHQLSLLPSFKERSLLIHLDGAPGASQPEMSRISGRMSAELRTISGVNNVAIQVGRAIYGDQVVNVNSAELWVHIDPSADYDKTASTIENVVNGYPGLRHTTQTYLNERSSEVSAASGNSITVRVYGDADKTLQKTAEEVQKAITGIEGVANARIILPAEQPTLEIEVNLAAAQNYGIKPGDVRRAAATMFSGLQVGALFQEQKVFDVVVWSTPETRQSISNIRDLMIDTPSGGRVRLGDVAEVRVVSAQGDIRHEAVKRYLDIVVGVNGRSLGSVAAGIQSRVEELSLPLEYHAEVLGGYAEQQNGMVRFLTFALTALLGIFLLLQSAFRSWRLAFSVLVTLPMSLTGGVVVVFLNDGNLSLGVIAGFLALVGIALRNGLIQFSHYQRLEQNDGKTFDSQLILDGSRERLVPTLASSFATGMAMVPILFLGDIPGLEIIRPMVAVTLGGFVTTLIVNLFVFPILYRAYGASREAELGLQPITGAEVPLSAD